MSRSLAHHKRSHNHGFIDFVKEKVSDPEQIFYFTLGVLSEWNSYAETVYEVGKPIYELVKACFDAKKFLSVEVKVHANATAEDKALAAKIAKDADASKQDQGLIAQMKAAYNYFSFASNAYSCMEGSREVIVKLLGNNAGFFEHSILGVVSEVASSVLHFFTGGATGAIKGGVYLVQFVHLIRVLYDINDDLAFKIGQAVGKAISATKAFLLGKKRRFRK
jgi:hypothetical protein